MKPKRYHRYYIMDQTGARLGSGKISLSSMCTMGYLRIWMNYVVDERKRHCKFVCKHVISSCSLTVPTGQWATRLATKNKNLIFLLSFSRILKNNDVFFLFF